MASISAHFVDTDTFIVSGSGEQTGIFHEDRRVQCYCGADGFKYGTILSSSYADPNNTINLTADSDNLTSNLIAVKYGIVGASPSGSMPDHDHTDSTGEGGVLDVYTQSQVDTLTDASSANALVQANTYSDETSANALAQANTYSDQASANAETQANAYTDTQVASVSAAADEGDVATLASAATYSDQASANAYQQAQNDDVTVLASANTYSDQASANAYQQAQNDDAAFMPTDASKSFSNPVSGQAPSNPNHLVTKTYADALSAADAFIDLTDTPADYSGDGLKLLQVNVGETAVEFVPSGGLATETYTQEASANALAQAVTADVTVLSNAATYSDQTSANALVQANLYSDGVSAQSEADDVATLASAATYSDETSANAEVQSNAYTDTQVASVSAAADEADITTLASAATYSDETSANALVQANTYSDLASANAETQANTYSDAASANALVQSWVFDPTPDADHTSSGEWATMQVDVNTVGIGGALHLDTDGNWVDADNSADTSVPCQGLGLEAGTGSKKVLFRGFMRDDTWTWTVGGLIYVGTSGALTQTAPSSTGEQVQIVGFATHADRMFFNPDYTIVEIA